MHEPKLAKPRWGNEERDRNAQASFATLVARCTAGTSDSTIGCYLWRALL
jgi:hypothetical protein